jgi:hypothetical protein
MAWEKLADVSISSEGDLVSSGTFTAKKYLMVQTSMIDGTGNSAPTLRVGTGGTLDTGSNYARRSSSNGGSDSAPSSAQVWIQGQKPPNAGNAADTYYIINISDKEKLIMCWSLNNQTSGAGTAPSRSEIVGKWVNTSAQIDIIGIANDDSGDFGIGSRITVYGTD